MFQLYNVFLNHFLLTFM